MAEPLNHLKNDYRARFCYEEGKQEINVQPGQNALKIIQDCFENCVSDSTVNSPSITYCSTPGILKQKEILLLTEELNSVLFSSVKEPFISTSSVVESPVKSVSSSGWSTEAHEKLIEFDDIVGFNEEDGCVLKEDKNASENGFFEAGDVVGSNKKANSLLNYVERSSQSPVGVFDVDEDNYEVLGSPVLLVEEAETSVHLLNFDEKATPAVMKGQTEVQMSESPQSTTQEQTVPEERMQYSIVPSEQKKSLSSAFLVAVTTGATGKRHSASMPLPLPSPVKDLDLEMEEECEFIIDEPDGLSFTSWFSIPKKNKKVEKQALAEPMTKSHPSEKREAGARESKKCKDKKAQDEVAVKVTHMEQSKNKPCSVAEGIQDELQNASDINLGFSDQKKDTLSSTRHSGPNVEESKKLIHGQRSTRTPNERKSTALKQIPPKKFTFSVSESDTETADKEQHKPTEILNEDSYGSCSIPESPQEEIVPSKENHNFPKPPRSSLKTTLCSSHKKQTAKRKLSKVASSSKLVENGKIKVRKPALKSSKKSRVLISEESSESEPMEEVDERELLKSKKVFTPSLQQESQTSELQMSHKSPKPKNVMYPLESSGNGSIKTPGIYKEPFQNLSNNIEYLSGRKRAAAKSAGQTVTRTNKINCLNPEDAEPGNTMYHRSSSGQDMGERKGKKSNASVKTKYRKSSNVHQSQVIPAPEKNRSHSSGPVLKRCIKFSSKNDEPIAYEQEDSSSDASTSKTVDLSEFWSNTPQKHRIVMPSNTPNVRRTRRIRLKPLEYWRGERVNYLTRPSGGFVVGGIVSPERNSCKKPRKRRKHMPKKGRCGVEHLTISLADASKPTAVWDPTINEEVLLDCVNTGSNHSCFFNDESVEIYKNLNTSGFAAGKLILKPLKEKGHQFVHTDKIAFHVIRGEIIFTLHKTSYYLTTGDFFYVPEGNGYNIRNLLDEESILLFTQLKGERPIIEDSVNKSSSP